MQQQQYETSSEWGDWDAAAYNLPSENEHKAKFEAARTPEHVFPEGQYQWAITNISPEKMSKPDQQGKIRPRRGFTFTCVDDPENDGENLGRTIVQWMNVTSHPKGQLYPYFKAAAGGYLDPNVNPRLIDLKDAQIIATVVHNYGDQLDEEGNKRLFQNFSAVRAARSKKEVVPF